MIEWGERCDACGWCDTPGRCVWSVTCPKCDAAPRQQCRTPGILRLEGLHAERWDAVGLDWRALEETAEFLSEVPVTYDARVIDFFLVPLDEWEELRAIEEGATA